MKSNETLDQSLARHSNPPPEQVESAVARVWRSLAPEIRRVPEDFMFSVSGERSKSIWRWTLVAAALVVVGVIAVGIVRNVTSLSGPTASVDAVDGTLYRVSGETAYAIPVGERIAVGETVRADGGAVLALTDRSRIEMRSGAEFTLEVVSDGTRLRLSRGSILVTAAKQGAGHLYVETKDVTVSVVGTVFLVNVEAVGSRVSVVEGKVSIFQAGVEEPLEAGGQISTSSLLELRPIAEEITWSRNATQHLALLSSAQAFPSIPVFQGKTGSDGSEEFDVVSVKRADRPPFGVPLQALQGVSCTGKDGSWYATMPGGVTQFTAGRGRCSARYVEIRALVSALYDVPFARITGAIPNWHEPGSGFEFGFIVEATAEDRSGVTTGQLRQMFKAAMIERFKLKVHSDPRQEDGFELVLVPTGAKVQRVADSEETAPRVSDDSRQSVISGKTSMKTLAEFLFQLGPRCTVIDKTGLDGIHDYSLTLRPVLPDLLSGKLINGAKPTPEQAVEMEKRLMASGGLIGNEPCGAFRGRAYDPPFNTALQQQLGLRLEAQKVPVEYIVIDEVREPAEN